MTCCCDANEALRRDNADLTRQKERLIAGHAELRKQNDILIEDNHALEREQKRLIAEVHQQRRRITDLEAEAETLRQRVASLEKDAADHIASDLKPATKRELELEAENARLKVDLMNARAGTTTIIIGDWSRITGY